MEEREKMNSKKFDELRDAARRKAQELDDQFKVHDKFAQGVNAAAGTCACLEDHHVMAQLRELVSSDKPGHSSAQNKHLPGRAVNDDCCCVASEPGVCKPNTHSRERATSQKLPAS